MSWPDAVGILGSILIVIAYFANLRGTLPATGSLYPLLNLAGAALILVSLWWAWNLAAVITEIFWGAISAYGVAQSLLRTRLLKR